MGELYPSSKSLLPYLPQFNLETPDSDLFKDHLRIYRSVSVSPPPPPFELQVLLSIPELAHNQVLVHLAPDSSPLRVDPTPRHILLESWLLSFNSDHHPAEDQADVAPSTIYKHGIPLFRSLYSLLRILPAWKVFKRLRRWTGGGKRSGVPSIKLRVPALHEDPDSVLGFSKPRDLK
jgi:autophagy-related protein 13